MTPWLDDGDVQLYHGDSLSVLGRLEASSVQTCVTSPPYWGLRDYGAPGQIGLEPTPDAYVAGLVAVFQEVRRVLRDEGTLWLNLGDSYATGAGQVGNAPGGGAQGERWSRIGRMTSPNRMPIPGLKPKDLVGIPWRVAFALQADGWYLRSDIIWSKPNPMPESVTDRPTKAHEYVFLLSKSARYFYDADAIREPITAESLARAGRNSRYDDPEIRNGSPYAAPRPRVRSGNTERKHGDERGRPGSNLGASIPWEDDGTGRNARTVWEIPTQPTPDAHFATFPEALVRRCTLAATRPGDVVLDPFIGSGTTARVSRHHGRRAVGIDLNADYLEIAARRLAQQSLLTGGAA